MSTIPSARERMKLSLLKKRVRQSLPTITVPSSISIAVALLAKGCIVEGITWMVVIKRAHYASCFPKALLSPPRRASMECILLEMFNP